MELGKFWIAAEDEKILEILSRITDNEIKALRRICERYGEGEEEIRRYDVYEIETTSGPRILKKTGAREAWNYETYLSGKNLPVPFFYGKWVEGEDVWILIERISGNDLRDMTDALAVKAADCLAQIQNSCWQRGGEDGTHARFEAYWKRILKRAAFFAGDSQLKNAYQCFLDRQRACPRTLSNGDLLACNVMEEKGGVKIIDWGFGGILPYSLDIARFIAHATETRSTFPFYMTGPQKRLFVDRVYQKLEQKPDYEQYLWDLKLAVLNEYLEFVEAEEDENGWYEAHARQLAEAISRESQERQHPVG